MKVILLGDGTKAPIREALDELRQWERRSMVSMIRGQGPFHTIWSRVV